MNLCVLSGWIRDGASWGYRDSTNPVLMFALRVQDDLRGQEHELRCRVENQALARHWEPLLTPGRVIFVRAEAITVPVERHGFTRSDVVAFRVLQAEFPNRSKPAEAKRAVVQALSEEAASDEVAREKEGAA